MRRSIFHKSCSDIAFAGLISICLVHLALCDSISINSRLHHFYQGTDDDLGFESSGKVEIRSKTNLDQLGIWKNAALTISAEYNFGSSFNNKGGVMMPVNLGSLYPGESGSDRFDIPSFYITKRVGKTDALMIGKLNMLEFTIRRGSGGAGTDYFQNIALVAPPSGLMPAYILGAMYAGRTPKFNYTVMIFDPNSAVNKSGLEDPFTDGVTGMVGINFPVKIGGRQGFQGFKVLYSTKDGDDLEDVFLAIADEARGKKQDRYFVGYTFKNFIYKNPDTKDGGWGIFGQVGMSDGNPSKLDYSFVVGIGGDSLTAARPQDRWGIGYYRYSVSDSLIEGLGVIGQGIENEYGIEVFYNFQVTPWLNITADFQYIDPVIKSKDNISIFGIRTSLSY
ncbi:MAG: carbohydrate porin [Puniceicoccaceae bacterium]